MKKFKKAKLIAKNLPTGSYAAGCPSEGRRGCAALYSWDTCRKCDRAS